MARVQALLECLGLALCDKARRALAGDAKFGDLLPDVAKAALDLTKKELPTGELRLGLGELAAMEPAKFAPLLTKVIDSLGRVSAVPNKAELAAYLESWPATIRQTLRRPTDPTGRTAPEGLQFFKPDDFLIFLPPRLPRMKPGAAPAKLDDWQLTEFQGLGEFSEVWLGTSVQHANHSPGALKFITDPAAAADMAAHQDLFVKVFELNEQSGIVPLRSVYLHADPPCLDVGYVFGYDLTSLIYDWKWKYDAPKPEASLKLVKRLAEIAGKAHKRGIVHRDLKPSNVLLHPSDAGKFTLWVSDFGWGQIQAKRSIELGRAGTTRGELLRLSLRGAHTPLYASPQLANKEAPDPRDDVHALGVIWYQLLKRDPLAAAPVGHEWVEPLRAHGFTDAQAKLLTACLSPRAEKRPADGSTLAEMIAGVAAGAPAAPAASGGRISAIKANNAELLPAAKAGPAAAAGHAPTPSLLSNEGPVKIAGPSPKLVKIPGKSSSGPVSGAMPAMVAMGDSTPDAMPLNITNSVGMTLALVPAGKFMMGSHPTEHGRRGDFEGPRHPVEISRPFYVSIYAVTQAQYEAVVGKNPAQFNSARGGSPNHPVENIAYHEAEEFCKRLSAKIEEELAGRTYRLPTEAEWEYACRGGTASSYSFGEKITPAHAHYASTGGVVKVGIKGHPVAVGQYPANGYGLYDMHGNVHEWVNDWYDENYYKDATPIDPQGPDRGTLKVVRGGCFAMIGSDCRCAARRAQDPDTFSETIGFRVVMTAV